MVRSDRSGTGRRDEARTGEARPVEAGHGVAGMAGSDGERRVGI